MNRRLFLSLVMLLLLAGTAFAQAGSVTGVVVDVNGVPVAGARVALMAGMGGGGGHGGGHGGGGHCNSYMVLTDANGAFLIPDVVAGTYRLMAGLQGVGAAHVDEVVVVDGQVTDVGVLTLVPKNQMGPGY